MSDEESFVILGSTPTPSMNGYIDQLDAVRSSPRAALNGTAPQLQVPPAPIRRHEQQQHSFDIGGSQPTRSISIITVPNGDVAGDLAVGETSAVAAAGTEQQPSSVNGVTGSHYSPATSAPVSVELPLIVADGLADAMLESGGSVRSVSSFRIPDISGQMLRAEENASMLQSSIVDYFPSLCTAASSPEDLQKLGSLVCEHLELKENLEKTNIAMRQHFGMINQWQVNVQKYKATKQREADKRQSEIVMLNDEVLTLNNELIDKSKHFELTCKLMQQENTDLVQQVSHQKSMLLNMSNQIVQFEKEAHSFELLGASMPCKPNAVTYTQVSNAPPSVASGLQETVHSLNEQLALFVSSKQEDEEMNKSLTERLEHSQATIDSLNEQLARTQLQTAELEKMKNVVLDQSICSKDMQKTIDKLNGQMQEVAVKNRQLEDMKQVYVDQINCLEVNLAAAEELLKGNGAEIAELKSIRTGLSGQLAAKEKNVETMESQLDVLRAQLDIYRDDFEAERKARQDLASERDEILSDLKLLQRRNEELMKASQQQWQSTNAAQTSGSASTSGVNAASSPRTTQTSYVCPVCNRKYTHLKMLESHVNDCLLNV